MNLFRTLFKFLILSVVCVPFSDRAELGQLNKMGGTKDSSLTVSTDGGLSSPSIQYLTINRNNTETLPLSMCISGWSFCESPGIGIFIIRLHGGAPNSVLRC